MSGLCTFSLGERIVGNCFPCVPGSSYRDIILYVWPIVEASEGKWDSRRTVEKRRGTLPEVGQTVRNERL